MRKIIASNEKKIINKVSLESIKKMVERELILKNIERNSRAREIKQARWIYFKLARVYCPEKSLAAIGRAVDRNHATVINGLNNWDYEIRYDPYMKEVYENISYIIEDDSIEVNRDKKNTLMQVLLLRIERLEKQLAQ